IPGHVREDASERSTSRWGSAGLLHWGCRLLCSGQADVEKALANLGFIHAKRLGHCGDLVFEVVAAIRIKSVQTNLPALELGFVGVSFRLDVRHLMLGPVPRMGQTASRYGAGIAAEPTERDDCLWQP